MSSEQVFSLILPGRNDASASRTLVVAPAGHLEILQRALEDIECSVTVLAISGSSVKTVQGTTVQDSWTQCDGISMRCGPKSEDGNESVIIEDVRDWAAPELEIITSTSGTAALRQRLRLPTQDGSSIVVGRLDSHADVVVDDEHMSREHIRITTRDQRTFVADANSKWGSTVNGIPLQGEVRLRHRDVIGCGKTRMVFFCYYDELQSDGLGRTIVSVPDLDDSPLPSMSDDDSIEVKEANAGASEIHRPASEGRIDSDDRPPKKRSSLDILIVVLGVVILAYLLYLGVTSSLGQSASDSDADPPIEETDNGH